MALCSGNCACSVWSFVNPCPISGEVLGRLLFILEHLSILSSLPPPRCMGISAGPQAGSCAWGRLLPPHCLHAPSEGALPRMEPPRACLHTAGCSVNVTDSASLFSRNGTGYGCQVLFCVKAVIVSSCLPRVCSLRVSLCCGHLCSLGCLPWSPGRSRHAVSAHGLNERKASRAIKSGK